MNITSGVSKVIFDEDFDREFEKYRTSNQNKINNTLREKALRDEEEQKYVQGFTSGAGGAYTEMT